MTHVQRIDPHRVRPDSPVYLRLIAEHGASGADWFDWFIQLDREAADAMGSTLSMMAAASKLPEEARRDLHSATTSAAPGYWRRAQMTAFKWMTDDDLRVACDAYLASLEHRVAVEREAADRLAARRQGVARARCGSGAADVELSSIPARIEGTIASIRRTADSISAPIPAADARGARALRRRQSS